MTAISVVTSKKISADGSEEVFVGKTDDVKVEAAIVAIVLEIVEVETSDVTVLANAIVD